MPWVAWCALHRLGRDHELPPLQRSSEWLLLRPSSSSGTAPGLRLHARSGRRRRFARCSAVGLRHGQVLRRGVPRPAAQRARRGARRRLGRAGLAALAAGCVLLGLAPTLVLALLEPVTQRFTGYALSPWGADGSSSRRSTPTAPATVRSCSSPSRRWWCSPHGSWCGPSTMGEPARAALGLRFPLARRAHAGQRGGLRAAGESGIRPGVPHRRRSAFAARSAAALPRNRGRPSVVLALPIARAVERLTALVTVLQRGRISVYLMYSFATLLALLFFIR